MLVKYSAFLIPVAMVISISSPAEAKPRHGNLGALKTALLAEYNYRNPTCGLSLATPYEAQFTVQTNRAFNTHTRLKNSRYRTFVTKTLSKAEADHKDMQARTSCMAMGDTNTPEAIVRSKTAITEYHRIVDRLVLVGRKTLGTRKKK